MPSTSSERVLLVISAQPTPTLRDAIAAGSEPRRDYFELQRALGADLLLPDDVQADRVARQIARRASLRAALAWLAFRRRHDYGAIYTDGEAAGLPLAALLRASGTPAGRPRHIMLTHYLTPAKKRLWFQLGAGSHVDALICHSSAQRERAIRVLGMPSDRVHLLPYFADERFWLPDAPTPDGADLSDVLCGLQPGFQSAQADFAAAGLPAANLFAGDVPPAHASAGDVPARSSRTHDDRPTRPTICSVGLEFRDYGTLVAAARELEADVEIAAASHWSHHSAFAGSTALPANVHVASYAYLPLRRLYQRAAVVVVPVRDVDNQAGVTVILEAMALGKPLVVTATRGQTDVIRDRRNEGRGRVARQWWPGFVDTPALDPALGQLPTGFYVAPGDPAELAGATRYLLDHPDVAAALGRNARRVFEACFTLDAFTARFAAVIRGEPQPMALAPLAAPQYTNETPAITRT